jgi:hypothetical protein
MGLVIAWNYPIIMRNKDLKPFLAPLAIVALSLTLSLFLVKTWNILSLWSALALMLSGLSSFLWLKEITNKAVGLFGAIVYMVFPYHLGLNIYWAFSLNQMWVFACLPFLLYLSTKIAQEKKYLIFLFTAFNIVLILSDFSAGIVFALVSIGYTLVLKQEKSLIMSFKLIASILLSFGISFLIHYKLFEIHNISLSGSSREYIEITSAISVVIAIFAWSISRHSMFINHKLLSHYWLTIAICTYLISIPYSQTIWRILNLSTNIPWIFNIALILSTNTLISLAIYATGNPVSLFIDQSKKIIIFSVAVFLLGYLETIPFYQKNLHILGINNSILLVLSIIVIAVGISFIKDIFDFKHQRVLIIEMILLFSLMVSSGLLVFYKIAIHK